MPWDRAVQKGVAAEPRPHAQGELLLPGEATSGRPEGAGQLLEGVVQLSRAQQVHAACNQRGTAKALIAVRNGLETLLRMCEKKGWVKCLRPWLPHF